jgi:DNA-binding NarL/FixJ family response regulator
METKTQWGVRKAKVRVLLVEDHPILRKGLAQLINQDPRLAVCGEAEDAPQAIKAIETLLPDLVIMDISLKLGNGIELLKTVKPHFPDLPVLVLSMHDETLYAERSLRAGAMGYLMKDEPAEQVLFAIGRVLAGEIFLSNRMKSRMMMQFAGRNGKARSSTLEQLTDRELEVFRLIGAGHTTREIADHLHLSMHTVQAYREFIKAKLKLPNSTQLVQHAVHWTHGHAAA